VARLRCQVASAVLLIAAHSAGPAIKSSNIPYQDAAQTALSSSYALRIIPLSNGFPSIEIEGKHIYFLLGGLGREGSCKYLIYIARTFF